MAKPIPRVHIISSHYHSSSTSLPTGGGKTLLLNDGNALGIGNVIAIMDTFIHQRTQPKQVFPRGDKRPNRPTRRGKRKRSRRRKTHKRSFK